MTELNRLFDVESRALKCVKAKTYAGQALDNMSATLHITYSDIDFLSPDEDGSSWKPYIVFNIRDADGMPFAYGQNSSPSFDGYTFSIPWDILSRMKNGRLEYQLVFSKVQYSVDERGVAVIRNDASNLRSSIDGLVIKDSIKPRCAKPSCAPPPFAEPSIQAILEMFKSYGIVAPVETRYDAGTDRVVLVFRTYNGKHDQEITLETPYLTQEGTIPPQFIDIIRDWCEANGDNLPSAEMVKDALDAKLDSSAVVDEWSDDPSAGRIPSEALVKDSLDKKVDQTQVVTRWSDPLSDSNIPSEKLVKSSLDEKTDIGMAIWPWDPSRTYAKNATVIYNGTIYISRRDDNRNNEPTLDEYNWSMVSAGSGALGSDGVLLTLIGDGIGRRFTVTHNLGTLNVFSSLRTNDEFRAYVEAKVCAINPNEITVEFTSPPAENGVTLMLATGDRTKSIYCNTIGNGVDREYIITHNIGTYNFYTEVRTNDAKREYVSTTIYAISPTQAKLVFENPVPLDGITVMLSPYIPSDWEGRWLHMQEDPMDEWKITHDLLRIVQVQTFDLEGREMLGEVVQDFGRLDSVKVRFSRPVSGYAFLL